MPALQSSSGPSTSPWQVGLTALLDLVFPPFCPVCSARLAEDRRDPLCGPCWSRVERVTPPWCAICGIALGRFATHRLEIDEGSLRCGACRTHPPAFTYARTAAHYDGVAQEALKAFKFGGRRALAAPLGDLVADIGRARLPISTPDLLVPVPLHPARERERGFNQALLLARRVGRAWDVAVESALSRRAATRPQTDLSAEERRVNVRGAFSVRRPERVAGRHVVVVDDIVTTGSTVDACAAALRAAGASTVGVVAAARAD